MGGCALTLRIVLRVAYCVSLGTLTQYEVRSKQSVQTPIIPLIALRYLHSF